MSRREQEFLSGVVATLSRRMDDALIRGAAALMRGSLMDFNSAYGDALRNKTLLSNIHEYLTQEVAARKDELQLH